MPSHILFVASMFPSDGLVIRFSILQIEMRFVGSSMVASCNVL
jgi:hypothetical protein